MKKGFARLSARLRELGLNQCDVGFVLGLSNSAVSHRFAGHTPWTLPEMYNVLDMCRAMPDELHLYFPRGGQA